MRNRFLPAGPAGAGWRRVHRRSYRSAAPAVIQALEERRLLAATLISDIDTRPGNNYRPTNITESGGVAYVGLNDGQSGPELWRSDGTAGGTSLIKDIHEGPAGSFPGALINSVTDADGTFYFAADDGVSGFELWKSDGTEAGTVQVADAWPGASGSYPTQLLAVGSGVYFFAEDGVHGRELWHSDGTPEGTKLVKDVRPGATGQLGKVMAALPDGTVFFYATDGAGHSGLWRTDGTPGGTIYLKGSAENFVTTSGPMVASGGWMYIPDAVGGLWRSDGTPARQKSRGPAPFPATSPRCST